MPLRLVLFALLDPRIFTRHEPLKPSYGATIIGVVGAGSSGIAAALAVGERGASVLDRAEFAHNFWTTLLKVGRETGALIVAGSNAAGE